MNRIAEAPLPERIVVITDMSSPTGGAELMALLSAEVMAEAGIAVTFVTGDTAAACPLDRSRIEVRALGEVWDESGGMSAGARAFYNRRSKAFVEEVVRTYDTPGTVYHLHNWTKLLSPSVFRALAPVSSRLLISAHDFALVCPNVSYSNYQRDGKACPLRPLGAACITTNCDRASYAHKLWRVGRTIERRLFANLAHGRGLVTVIHPDMLEYFTRGGVGIDRLRVLRNAVQPYAATRLSPETQSDLFFIGRVVHEKGVDLAAEAARLAGRRLRVIGDGAARAELERLYPEVIFEGWRSHDEISALVADARALLVPSRLPETFTLVAHEAMRSGIPVIAFSDVDCREAAELGAAIVAPPRSAAALADAINCLEDDGVVAAMSRAAFAHAKRFSNTRDSWRDVVLGLYGELMQPLLKQEAGANALVQPGISGATHPELQPVSDDGRQGRVQRREAG